MRALLLFAYIFVAHLQGLPRAHLAINPNLEAIVTNSRNPKNGLVQTYIKKLGSLEVEDGPFLPIAQLETILNSPTSKMNIHGEEYNIIPNQSISPHKIELEKGLFVTGRRVLELLKKEWEQKLEEKKNIPKRQNSILLLKKAYIELPPSVLKTKQDLIAHAG